MTGRIVVIGASMFGIEALSRLVALLPAAFPAPILVAQHVRPTSAGYLPAILSRRGPLPAVHPESGQRLEAGHIYVAPPDRHLLVEDSVVRLSHGPRENHVRPAIDPLFRSAALAQGPAVVGVVLTGLLNDGTAGLLAIKDCGGIAVVQDPAEAQAPSMPRSALQHVAVDHCLPLAKMAQVLVELAQDPPAATPPGNRELLAAEHAIACGYFGEREWAGLEPHGRPSALNCPACRSALYELRDERVLRFRCRSGHAWAAQDLLAAQAVVHEDQLGTLFGLAAEEAALARRLAGHGSTTGDPVLGAALQERIRSLEQEARQVGRWLRAWGTLREPA